MRPDRLDNPLCFVRSGWRHRSLIRRLTWRRIETQYRGTMLGLLWTLVQPLLMLAVYTLVFSVVFRARWNVTTEGNSEFALFVFSGLILYTVFARCANEAPGLLAAHQTYIKQIVFPSEILAWVAMLAALTEFAVSLVLLIGFYLFILGPPPLTSLLLPLAIAPTALLTLGAVWLLAPLGVFLKDVSQVVGALTTGLLFLSPIFYPVSRIPESLRPYWSLNPFAGILESSRDLLFHATLPDWRSLAILTAVAWLAAWLGFAWFMRTKEGLADSL